MQRQQLVSAANQCNLGTGSNAVKGLLEQNVIDLRAITRKIALNVLPYLDCTIAVLS